MLLKNTVVLLFVTLLGAASLVKAIPPNPAPPDPPVAPTAR
jgi:hypothetical protein